MYADLDNAPPRLSDVYGDERMQALADRHRATTRNWLETRKPQPFLARLFGRAA